VVVLILVSAITFLLVNLAPGGPSSLMRMDATPEQRQALAARLGLDQPIPVRYVQWLGGALHGDLGTSLSTSEPVSFRIEQRLPNTLVLATTALAVSIVLGIPLGMIAALRRNSIPDFVVAVGSVVGLSVPAFWLGMVLILLLSVEFH
jgi:peptide/nickel transport system permease protein